MQLDSINLKKQYGFVENINKNGQSIALKQISSQLQ